MLLSVIFLLFNLASKNFRRFAAIFLQKHPEKISPLRGDFSCKNILKEGCLTTVVKHLVAKSMETVFFYFKKNSIDFATKFFIE